MARLWDLRTMAPVLIWILYLSTKTILAREVVLLDSTKFSRLSNWTTHKVKPDDSTNHGWREGSYTSENGSPIRVFASCSVSSTGVDNWLRTPYIPRLGANSLRIEVRFSMRRCVRHSDPSSIKQCKETFNLYYYLADSDIANSEMPSWDAMTYTSIDKIAADHLYDDTTDIQMNTELLEVPLDRNLNGVYIAFQDLGACVTIISVKVYYILCPNITYNYAFFMETPTSGSELAYEEQTGTCVANAQLEQTPTYLCLNAGTWAYDKGGCQCLPGYEGRDGQVCVECKPGYYKWSLGNELCSLCPSHSFTTSPKSIECTCDDGYFRAKTDQPYSVCTQPPSAPQQLRAELVSHNSIVLTWRPPLYNGGRTDIRYRVECQACGSTVTYQPDWKNLNTTRVTISGLRSSTSYIIKILAENGVTTESNKPAQYSEGTYVTKSTTQTIVNNRILSVGTNTVSMAWEVAPDLPNRIIRFQVKWYPRWKTGQEMTNDTTALNYTFSELMVDQEYSFQVRGYAVGKGFGDFTDPLHARTGSTFGENQFVTTEKTEMDAPLPSVGIIVGAVLAVILCMVIATAMIVLLLKKNRRDCGMDAKGGDYDHQPYNPGEVVHFPPVDPHLNGGLTMPLFPPNERQTKTYVDPHTYEDPNQAVREFTREIDASHITIESVIGGGEFGDVCKGKLRIPCKPEMSVAIKTLKPGATDKNRLDFLTEASIMGQFDDPNVIFLEGVVTKSHPIMIVTEYMENGSLDAFLRNNDGKFTVIQLVGMMRGIASGMRYLSNMGYVHRDLAARNILTNCILVCKVADFGLSREIDIDTSGGAYTTKGGKIPVRWTAPEAISFRKFTSASDVWSYGVVMWEVISYGERPYWNWSNQDVIRAVDKGYRLPPPMDCPEAIHQLMLDCWQKERGNRPKFDTIVRSLDKFIRAPELLRKIAKPRPEQLSEPAFSFPVQEVSRFSNVEGWLISIKMEKYIDNFINAGYRTMEQVLSLTPRELESRLGVTLIGHQKKILGSLQVLRAQRYGPSQYPMQMSDGFLV